MRKDFALRDGRRIGVVSHRDGKLALIVSKADDPDASLAELPLTTDEAGALANLLGAPQLVAQLSEEHRDLPGIRTGQLPIAAGSPFDGRTLGDTALRSRTGRLGGRRDARRPGAPSARLPGLHPDRGRPAGRRRHDRGSRRRRQDPQAAADRAVEPHRARADRARRRLLRARPARPARRPDRPVPHPALPARRRCASAAAASSRSAASATSPRWPARSASSCCCCCSAWSTRRPSWSTGLRRLLAGRAARHRAQRGARASPWR